MVDNISEKQLKFGYWFVLHKIALRKGLIGFLLLLNTLVWGFGIYSLAKTFGIDFAENRQLKADLLTDRFVQYEGIARMLQPKDIQIVGIQRLASVDNKIDLVATVKNLNANWAGHFTYKFLTDKGQTETRRGFIMPGEQKFLYDLDIDALRGDRLVIENLIWTRINDYRDIAEKRNRFVFSDIQFIPVGSGDSVSSNRAIFTVTNDSNYNFYKPMFVVQLMNQGRLVGFNTVTSADLYSRQKLTLESRWFETLPTVDRVIVTPDIDFLSDSSFIPL